MTFPPVKFTKHREPDPNTLSAIKKNVLLFTFVPVSFLSLLEEI